MVKRIFAFLIGLSSAWVEAEIYSSESPHTGRVQVAKNGRWSLDVRDMALSQIIDEMARQSGARLVLRGAKDISITDRFDSLSLDQALQRLVGDTNYAIVFQREEINRNAYDAIELYVIGDRRRAEVRGVAKDPTNRRGQRVPAKDLEDADAGVRRNAIQKMAASTLEERYSDLVRILITDADESVRAEAANALASLDGEAHVPVLIDALDDASDAISNTLLNALVSSGNAPAIAAFFAVLERAQRK